MTEIKASDLHEEWLATRPGYKAEYDGLEGEFALAEAMIRARTAADLTQAQLAERMHTSQAMIARLESGRFKPSARTLEKLAAATGLRLRISFEAVPAL